MKLSGFFSLKRGLVLLKFIQLENNPQFFSHPTPNCSRYWKECVTKAALAIQLRLYCNMWNCRDHGIFLELTFRQLSISALYGHNIHLDLTSLMPTYFAFISAMVCFVLQQQRGHENCVNTPQNNTKCFGILQVWGLWLGWDFLTSWNLTAIDFHAKPICPVLLLSFFYDEMSRTI